MTLLKKKLPIPIRTALRSRLWTLGPESYRFAIPGIEFQEVTDTVTDLKLLELIR